MKTPKPSTSPTPPTSEPAPVGLACPRCGCAHLPVYYTRQRPGGVLRVRFCRHCGRRVVTHERV